MSYIDTKLGAFKNTFPLQDDSSDSESKKLRREVEAKKLKFKGNEQQFLFSAEVEDYSSSALDSIKRNDSSQVQTFLETSVDLIRKRQKLITLADKSDPGWLVVQEYEQEELADDSEDEKRIKKAQRRLTGRNGRWQAPPRSPVSIARALLLLLMTIGSFFEVMCPSLPFLCYFPGLVLSETSYPTCIRSCCLLSLFFLAASELEGKYFSFGRTW